MACFTVSSQQKGLELVEQLNTGFGTLVLDRKNVESHGLAERSEGKRKIELIFFSCNRKNKHKTPHDKEDSGVTSRASLMVMHKLSIYIPALTNNNIVAFVDTEAGGEVSRGVRVSLLITIVFANVVQVVASNDDRPLHLVRLHNTLENTSSNANVAGERALLVDVLALDGLLRGADTKTHIAEETLVGNLDLLVGTAKEDCGLLLESSFGLHVQNHNNLNRRMTTAKQEEKEEEK